MDLSILIVNYNTCQLTVDCLRSVFASETGYTYEVIVIDNNSKDASVQTLREQFPQVKLIENTENTGFAKANNQGMAVSQGRYVLLLNSDTVIQTDTIQTMVAFMDDHPSVGASGCKIILPDGSLDKACKRGFPTPSASFYYAFGLSKLFPNNPRFNQYQLGYLDPDQEYPVDCLVGAFMLVRKETLEQVGGLDETFSCMERISTGVTGLKRPAGAFTMFPAPRLFIIKAGARGDARSRLYTSSIGR